MKLPFEVTDLDRRIWLEELDEFVPRRVFDAHTHIYHWDFYNHPQKDQTGYYALFGRTIPEASWEMADACEQVFGVFDSSKINGFGLHAFASPGNVAGLFTDEEASGEFVEEWRRTGASVTLAPVRRHDADVLRLPSGGRPPPRR